MKSNLIIIFFIIMSTVNIDSENEINQGTQAFNLLSYLFLK
jgi:hypothetical protein